MALDPLVTLLFPLQEVIFDKDGNGPLADGVVTFYEDNSRTVLKPIYQLSGNGPYSDASYVQLNNPIYLSSIGSFIDNNGNDIIPYLFPYDGVPGNTKGTVDLYYITVYSSGGILQFTREAWPNTAISNGPPSDNNLINYVPNPQFLLHNNIPAWSGNSFIAGNVPAPNSFTNANAVPASASVTNVAQGGWDFHVPTGTTSVNTVLFVTQPPESNPDVSADPRYVIDIQCTSSSNTDTFKDLCLTFPDVNKFASASTENNYTFSFQGQSLTGAVLPVQIRLLKYFGSGGSPSSSADTAFGLGAITINTFNGVYNIQGLFGSNAGQTLGSNNDDYLQIAIRLPNSLSHIQLSDFVLTNGAVTIEAFPVTTNSQMLDASTAGWIPTPDPNGFDLYCPMIYTPTGCKFDRTNIGKIYSVSYYEAQQGELLCDGTQYQTSAYSSDGIPYARLQSVLFDNNSAVQAPIFGTGAYFVSTYIAAGLTATLRFTTNIQGSVTAAADSIINPTGFAFASLHTGATYNMTGYSSGPSSITVIGNVLGAPHSGNLPAAGTSGFTATSMQANSNQYQVFSISSIAAATSLAGLYFTFSNTTTDYYVWFKVNGAGSDPAPGGTGIQINLISTYTATDVTNIIREAISGYQNEGIGLNPAASIAQSSYWTFQTLTASSTQNYYVWYNTAGGGTDPLVASAIGIPVAIGASDANTVVATKTQAALNSTYFATPDLRGKFIRASDIGAGVDYNAGSRINQLESLYGSYIGTLQLSAILEHNHTLATTGEISVFPASGSPSGTGTIKVTDVLDNTSIVYQPILAGTTGITGAPETTPLNIALYYVIKY